MSRAKASAGRKRAITAPEPDYRDVRAASLDRVADLELTMGHVAIAERLARMADEIREGAR